jgi:hypothetical protein
MVARGSKRGHRDGDGGDEGAYSKATAVVVVVPPRNTRSSSSVLATADDSKRSTSSSWQAKLEQLAAHLAQTQSPSSPSSSAAADAAAFKGDSRPWRSNQHSGATNDGDGDSPYGSVFSSIQQWKKNDDVWDSQLAALQRSGRAMRATVQDQLDRLSAALEERSEQNYRMQLRITELKAAHQSAAQHVEQELEARRSTRRHELSTLEAQLESIHKEARKLFREQGEEIPRLQHMIALYSSCTGIKWYDDDDDDDTDDDDRTTNAESATTTMMTTPDSKLDKGLTRRTVWRGEVVREDCWVGLCYCCARVQCDSVGIKETGDASTGYSFSRSPISFSLFFVVRAQAVPALQKLQEFTFDAGDAFRSANAVWQIMSGTGREEDVYVRNE